VVVLHDRDLMRMAGDARRIGELSMADLAAIDVGLRYGPAFTGERVPSLETVIDLVRGHMKLNVELKYNAPDPRLAAAVVDVLRRNDFLDAVVISSLNAAALREIKAIEPRLRTGQIVTAAVGDVTRADSDFLSLNSARATAAVVRRAHAAGKEVHVWTVNRPEVMLRMIERGVDNIITDDPALAMRVLCQLRALDPAERLALRLRVLFSSSPPETLDPHAVAPL
jgi:glycerophosphoryl diester phosphodiesterase